jgi:GSH-dependent disulfide-bond oxidoreductase
MIDLYYYTSPNVRKVLIALEELGLPYTIKWTDIREGDQFLDDYLRINPNAKVPAVVDHDGPGGRPLALFESGAILLYLAEKSGRLLPEDPVRRWDAICWVFWQAANQGPMVGQATHFIRYAPQAGVDSEYARGRYTVEAQRLYRILDDRLAESDYIVGEFSVADIACFPWTRVAAGHGIDVADYPNVQAWTQRIGSRPSAKVRIPEPTAGTPAGQYTPEQFQRLFRPTPTS